MYRKEPCYTEITDKDGTVLIKQGKVMTTRDWRNLCNSGREYLEVDPASILGLFLAADLVNPTTGVLIGVAGDEVNAGVSAGIHGSGCNVIQSRCTRL